LYKNDSNFTELCQKVFEPSEREMKLLIAALLVASVASNLSIDSRIASGTDAKDGMAKCYVTLVIEGETTGIKTCGGCLLYPDERIVTSASCLFSASEEKATSVKVYPGLKGPSGTEYKNEIIDIFPHSDYIASNNLSRRDVAVILYADKFKTVKNSFEASGIPNIYARDAYVGQNLVVCGFGNTDNKKSKPKTLQCTTLRVVPAAECDAFLNPELNAPVEIWGIICTKNIDDKNACGGDLGAPVFSNATGTTVLVGVVSLYPDTRPNARCQDGHHVVITQLAYYAHFLINPDGREINW
jgi:secreted trypsin-like serine protease